MTVFTLVEMPELFVETMLSFEGNSHDGRWLTLTPTVNDEVSTSPMSVVPGGLDQETTDVDVAGFSDRTPILLVAGGVL